MAALCQNTNCGLGGLVPHLLPVGAVLREGVFDFFGREVVGHEVTPTAAEGKG